MMATSSSLMELVGQLCRDGLYLEAVQRCVLDQSQAAEDRALFLSALQMCLDHVITSSPAHLPALMEILFPRLESDEGVLLVLGRMCLRREMHAEAEHFLLKVLTDVNVDCLLARESLRMMYEMVIPRWHFHMLNDFVRNSSYSQSILRAVARIPDCTILDIGSGTGLLSMLAVRSGAARVYACEMDVTMAVMSRDIIAANGMADKVSVINKISTDLVVPDDISDRVNLVVTETVDAGLLGEAIVKNFRHAWSHLLLPREPARSTNQITGISHVIPCGATVFVMAIECPYIARHSRLTSDVVGGLTFRGVTIEGSCKGFTSEATHGEHSITAGSLKGREDCGRMVGKRSGEKGRESGLTREPYTCERLSCISGGYQQLTDVHPALFIDFTNPEVPLPNVNLALPVVREGCLDAMATYYDLHLDSEVSISTSPHGNQNCSWEQAVYPISTSEAGERENLRLKRGDVIHLCAVCTDTLLHVNIERIERKSVCSGGDDGDADCPIPGSSTTHFIDRGAMCRLNDAAYHEVYSSATTHALQLLHSYKSRRPNCAAVHDECDMIPGSTVCETSTESETSTEGDIDLSVSSADLSSEGSGSESESESSSSAEVAEVIVLDLSHELSVLGLIAANKGADFVLIGRCHDIYKALLEEILTRNGIVCETVIKWAELEMTSEPSILWDVVLCDVVSPQGILRPSVFEEIGKVKECLSHHSTVFLPGKVKVHCVGISSPDLRAQTAVLGSVPTLGLDIARFINKYQVSHYIDLDLNSLPHESLTQETELLTIDFHRLSSTPFKVDREVVIEVKSSGVLTGFVYWFSLHFPTGEAIVTLPHPGETKSHWHQAAFCLQEDMTVTRGDKLTLRSLVSDSLLDISSVRTTSDC